MSKILGITALIFGLAPANSTLAGEKNFYCCNPGDGSCLFVGTRVSKSRAVKTEANRENIHFKEKAIFSLAVGSEFSHMRAEFEPSYTRTKHNSAPCFDHINVTSVLGNLYVGLPFEGRFINYVMAPYTGAGIGFSNASRNWKGVSSSPPNHNHSNVLAYQGIAGLRFVMTEQVGVNVEYRYFSTEKLNVIGKRLRTHSGNIGITYRF